ncbi:MAG: family 20 glycosylhydrolase [Planctomycetota bacterium]
MSAPPADGAPPVVPRPTRLEAGAGRVAVGPIACREREFAPQVEALVAGLQALGAPAVFATDDAAVVRVLRQPGGDDDESYAIEAAAGRLVVRAASSRGMARAAATLLQLVQDEGDRGWWWPAVRVDDAPALSFRCLMVDLGRHPHPPAVVRAAVDACWFYKVALLQLHLSDDQLCSWPSTAFPRLHDARSMWTHAEFVALEAYAAARGVALVPEIDVPGHSAILRERYPEVFGRTAHELATLASAVRGVQDLIDELLAVFASSPYVHLGGDEARGVPPAAQRAFLNGLARHVRSRGRRAIVWEGTPIGDPGDRLDLDVLQVSWNTTFVPPQQLLDAGYQVVNAAWDPMCVVQDHRTGACTAVPVQRCYEWQPRRFAHVDDDVAAFARPHVVEEAGAAAVVGFCMPWWEGRPELLLGMCVPRLAAVASVAWNRAGERDFADFAARQRRQLPRYERLAGVQLPRLRRAEASTQADNLAFGAAVTVSAGASQPVHEPACLTNGILDPADSFLGFPTRPDPLEITVDLGAVVEVARVVVHEVAIGDSHEVYEVLVAAAADVFDRVGAAGVGTRGDRAFVEHRFTPRPARFVRVRTRGCEGLGFRTFSRLVQIEAFGR